MNTRTIAAPAAVFFCAAVAAAASPDAAAGKAIYTKQCAACHGPEGVPRDAFAKRMGVPMRALGSREVQAKPDDQLRKDTVEGVGKMHGIKLKPAEAADVIAYLRALGKLPAAAKAEPAAKAAPAGDAAKGKVVYTKQCAPCHTATGAGRGTMRSLAAKEVQAKSDAELRKDITAGVGKMKPVKLAAADLDNVIAFVRTLK